MMVIIRLVVRFGTQGLHPMNYVAPMSYIFVALIIGILILIHEAGHFFTARRLQLPIRRFSIGFGPALWTFKRATTEYRVSVFPLGGYVLLDMKDENSYPALPFGKRILFALGGPLANILFTMLVFATLNILTAGVSLKTLLALPITQTVGLLISITSAFSALFDRPGSVTGIVGIMAEGSRFIGLNLERALLFASALSLNLAFLNLLPLPPLDGGKIAMDILHRMHEKISRIYIPATVCGWLLVIALMTYATTRDIGRYLA